MINLYSILLENLDIDRLIEEGKDPVELLHYKFQNVPSDIIDNIIAIDPTKKKSYAQWVLKKWNEEDSTIQKALQDGRLEKLFNFFKEHQEKQIKDCPSVQEGLDAYVPKNEDTVLDKSSEPETYVLMLEDYVDSELANDFDIVFNQDNWLIAVPNTYEASCKLGENCWWCTANHFGNGESYYDEYLSEGGKYYINFDLSQGETLNDRTRKDYPYTRYQFHFESKQFKAATEGEPDVNPADILPRSAYEFYEEHEGKDMSDCLSEEEKMENYINDRWGDAIKLNDELYLNVEYDDDYEYHEPSLESDDWYVFDENDDRDPISYTEVNPNGIKYNSDDGLIIIECANGWGGYVALIKGAGKGRWREWGDVTLNKYILLDNYEGIMFGVTSDRNNNDDNYIFAIGGYEPSYENIVGLPKELFINKNFEEFNNGYGYFEVVLEDGYHSLLYGTDDGISYIIHKDAPVNGKCFIPEKNENGETIIKGTFRTYNLGKIMDGPDEIDYHLDRKLENGDYLVAKTETIVDGWGRSSSQEVFNVLDGQTRQTIFENWAKAIEEIGNTYIFINKDKIQELYDIKGNLISNDKYVRCGRITSDINIFGAEKTDKKGYDLIDGDNAQVFASFATIELQYKPTNNRIIVGEYSEKTGQIEARVYDYKERRFVDENYENVYTIPCGLMIGKLPNNKGTQIFKYGTGEVVVDNIKTFRVNKIYKQLVFEFNDGKQNGMNFRSGKIYSPFNFDQLVETNNDDAEFLNDNKYYIYNYVEKKFILNPNGLPARGFFHMYGSINFEIPNSSSIVAYFPKYDMFTYRESGTVQCDMGRGKRVDENTPQEIINFINQLKGNNEIQPNNTQTEEVPAMAENFKRMLNRINEARRLLRNDFID